MFTMSRRDLLASSTKPRVPAVSRNWQSVSKAIQKLAAGVLVVKNEGVFPYERQAACGSGWAEEGNRYRGAQYFGPAALVEAGGMAQRGRF